MRRRGGGGEKWGGILVGLLLVLSPVPTTPSPPSFPPTKANLSNIPKPPPLPPTSISNQKTPSSYSESGTRELDLSWREGGETRDAAGRRRESESGVTFL